jgi:hypothetical protein
VNSAYKNKELPLWLQSIAFFALWIVWVSVCVWVRWKVSEYEADGRSLADPFSVYAPLYIGIPLVFVTGGLVFFCRVGSPARLPVSDRLLYYVLAAVTILTALSIPFGCMMPFTQIRE